MTEQLIGGGKIVKLNTGRLAVEGVPHARRGLVVESASSHADGTERRRGRYQVTRRVVAGTDLYHVRPLAPVLA